MDRLLTLADFEWARVGPYISYITDVCCLDNVDEAHLYSFAPTVRTGWEGVLKRKYYVKRVLTENQKKLTAFVGGHKNDIGEYELVVLRSMYRSMGDALQTVDAHIAKAKQLLIVENSSNNSSQANMFDIGGGDDELPF